jgi:hypothetical protein
LLLEVVEEIEHPVTAVGAAVLVAIVLAQAHLEAVVQQKENYL